MIHGHGQSDDGIVPEKSPNKPQGAEGREGRPPVKGNAQEPHITGCKAGRKVCRRRWRAYVKQ